MKYRNIFFKMIGGMLLCACTIQPFSIRQGQVLDLETAIRQKKNLLLSDLSDSLQCIPLETNDSSLLGKRCFVLYADEQNIFVKSDYTVYRFNSDGRFLNKIGQHGNAPGEYNVAYSISVDQESQYLLYYVGQKKVQFWGYDGLFQKEIQLRSEGEITVVKMLNTDRLLAEKRSYSDDGLQIYIELFDMEGNLLKQIPMNSDSQKVSLTMKTVPLMYTYGSLVKYKDINCNTLYSFDNDSESRDWILNFGSYTPSRELLEDVSQKETLLRDYVQLVDIQESDNTFYFLTICDGRLRGIVVDKESGSLRYSQAIGLPQMGGGIENDYIKDSCFWPSFISDSNVMYALLPVEKLTDAGALDMKRYLSHSTELIMEANPVVMKVYGK